VGDPDPETVVRQRRGRIREVEPGVTHLPIPRYLPSEEDDHGQPGKVRYRRRDPERSEVGRLQVEAIMLVETRLAGIKQSREAQQRKETPPEIVEDQRDHRGAPDSSAT